MPVYKRQGKRGTAWVVSVSIQGQRIKRSLGPGSTRQEAKQLEARILSDKRALRQGKRPQRHLDEALAAYLNASTHLRSYSELANHVEQIASLTIGQKLEEAPRVAEEIIQHGRNQGWSNATINRRLAAIRRACNLAYKHWGWTDEPVGDRIRMAGSETARHIYLSPQEVEAIAAMARHQWVADLIRLAAYTGLRKGELMGLDPTQVQGDRIELGTDTKSGKPRTVPLHPEVQAAAMRLANRQSVSHLDKLWREAREKAGLPHVRFHDLRHTNASWLIQNGADLVTVRDLLGHANVSVTNRYSHIEEEQKRAAIHRIGMQRTKSVPNDETG